MHMTNNGSSATIGAEEKDMAKTSKKRLQWEKDTQKIFAFKVSRISESEMVEFLNGKESVNAYVKELIRKDMQNNGCDADIPSS